MLEFITTNWLDIAQALLAVLGGLKVLARYTPTEADDHVLAAIEAPFRWLLAKFGK